MGMALWFLGIWILLNVAFVGLRVFVTQVVQKRRNKRQRPPVIGTYARPEQFHLSRPID
jgi:hypothetical protein